MMIKCGYKGCKGKVDVERGILNVERYGDNIFVFTCSKCGGKISISFERIARITDIRKAPKNAENSFD